VFCGSDPWASASETEANKHSAKLINTRITAGLPWRLVEGRVVGRAHPPKDANK
jgi:hypothetical protein